MTEEDFMDFMDKYWNNLKLFWKDKKRRIGTLKDMRDLIDNYFED